MFGASAAFPVFTFFFGCAGLLDIDLFLKPAPALRVFLFGVWPDSTMGLLLSEAVWSTVVSSFSLSSWSPMSAWASSSWASPSLFFFSPLASSPLGAPRDVLGCLGVPHLPLPRPLPLPLPRPRGFGLPSSSASSAYSLSGSSCSCPPSFCICRNAACACHFMGKMGRVLKQETTG